MDILNTYVLPLKRPINDVLETYILPLASKGIRLDRRNKLSILAAVALISIYLQYDKVANPPRPLRHLPRVSLFSILKAQLQGKSNNDIARELTLPIALQSPEGMYMRFGPFGWAVHIVRPEASKRFLLKTDAFQKAVDTQQRHTFLNRLGTTNNLLALNGAHWKSQRKVANPAFHRSMPIELFGSLTTKLFGVIDGNINQGTFSMDFHDLTERWALDALGLAGFGFNFNAIADHNNEWVVRYSTIAQNMFGPFYLLFPICDTTLLRFFPKRQKVHQELTKFLHMPDEIIVNKRHFLSQSNQSLDNIKENEKDLLTLMIEAGNEGEQGGLSDIELKENLSLFFTAGHDTTSNALACAIYHMAVNQTLRFNPPLAETTPRAAAQDTELAGTLIPKGAAVFTGIFEIHHNPTVWKDPENFDPERFASGGEAEKIGSSAWQPFITGPRQCIGMNLSLAEQRVFLPMLLRKYEWSLPQDSIHKEGLITTGIAIVTPKDLKIEFKRRY